MDYKKMAFAAVAAGLVAGAAQAQGKRFEDIDLDRNGRLDRAELVRGFGQEGLSIIGRDQDGDGLISKDEIRATQTEGERAMKQAAMRGESGTPGAAQAAEIAEREKDDREEREDRERDDREEREDRERDDREEREDRAEDDREEREDRAEDDREDQSDRDEDDGDDDDSDDDD
ncbi:hypothetical protein [Profundibacterium mesophilum]|uniref:EF hand domain containing protein n=1 Tax=Profundibacterium mesophilum KAUST100406-0324 TaxID=1037889 RepID=A0A921TDH6_9RHOB|nr:hypothetical protein [Profundibacterium mesophilum]KAF0676828.1 EF hand domain containing protein [Profundibacterium mesophilum KAUST100406-0324]